MNYVGKNTEGNKSQMKNAARADGLADSWQSR
jgi:hypothetical protein